MGYIVITNGPGGVEGRNEDVMNSTKTILLWKREGARLGSGTSTPIAFFWD